MPEPTMFSYLQKTDQGVVIEAAYHAVRRLFQAVGGPVVSDGQKGVEVHQAPASSPEALADRILHDIEQREHRRLQELSSDRVAYYTNLLTAQVRQPIRSSSKARETLLEMRSAMAL